MSIVTISILIIGILILVKSKDRIISKDWYTSQQHLNQKLCRLSHKSGVGGSDHKLHAFPIMRYKYKNVPSIDFQRCYINGWFFIRSLLILYDDILCWCIRFSHSSYTSKPSNRTVDSNIVIVLSHEPSWIYENKLREDRKKETKNNNRRWNTMTMMMKVKEIEKGVSTKLSSSQPKYLSYRSTS